MLLDTLNELVEYGKAHLGLEDLDDIYARNTLLMILGFDEPSYKAVDVEHIKSLSRPDELVEKLTKELVEEGKADSSNVHLLIDELIGVVSYKPQEFLRKFNEIKLSKGTDAALDFFYDYQIKNNYVAKSAIDKNIVWEDTSHRYKMEISINLSKPEKSNADILKAKLEKSTAYPKCLLCEENLGYWGSLKKAPRRTIRYVPCKLGGEDWFLQYSPYGYYYEHAICINRKHADMSINHGTFTKLLDFLDEFPGFFVGSNADLPIVGGSILSHEHYQGGRHLLPVFSSKEGKTYVHEEFKDVRVSHLKWYNSTIKLASKNKESIAKLACRFLDEWRKYDDESVGVISNDNNGLHNTITPCSRKEGEEYALYLILRNNRCDEVNPEGIFHAHKEYHNIKKEGIGLIEAMGLFILPARLKRQMGTIEEILSGKVTSSEVLSSQEDMGVHKDMINSLVSKYGTKNTLEEAKDIVTKYIGDTCEHILENTAVFKENEAGEEAFDRFMKKVGF
jgi:UDPglucose--hexose-1-phosphate uridylyltransferase